MGPQTDVAQFYNGSFKAGFNRLDVTTDQVSALGPDTAIATGKYKVTGKNQSGAPTEAGGFWTATYVREGGKLKIRMLTGVPQPPPAK
jgi:ketosteroid isomerase-like protein